nr:MAG TPA: DNA mismatch endonuclease [Caudoviricetes sp.]
MINYLKCESYAKDKISKKLFGILIGHVEILIALGGKITTSDVYSYIDKLIDLPKRKNKRLYYECVFGKENNIYDKIHQPLSNDFKTFLKSIGFGERRYYDNLESFILVGINDMNDIKDRLTKISKLSLNGITREKMLLRYGDIVGEYKWKSYCNKQRECGCSLKYFIEKYGEEQGTKKYNDVSKSKAVTLEKSIERHGEEAGKKLFEDYCKKQAYSGNSLGYFIEKYGEEQGTNEYKRVCEQKKLNKQNFIRKYGEVEGNVRFEQWKSKINNRPKFAYSQNSQQLFWKIFDLLDDNLKNDCLFEEHGGEYMVSVDDNIFFIDFAIPSLKYAIEFYGNYYHANPKIYKKDYYFKNLHFTSENIWEKDAIRLDKIKSTNIFNDIIIIWESDIELIDVNKIAIDLNEKYKRIPSK